MTEQAVFRAEILSGGIGLGARDEQVTAGVALARALPATRGPRYLLPQSPRCIPSFSTETSQRSKCCTFKFHLSTRSVSRDSLPFVSAPTRKRPYLHQYTISSSLPARTLSTQSRSQILHRTITIMSADSAAMASAEERVLSINELLSMILEQLPGRKIFAIQSVSKHWRAIIQASPTIQKNLFLRAEGAPVTPPLDGVYCLDYPIELQINELVQCNITSDAWTEPPEQIIVDYGVQVPWRLDDEPAIELSCDSMFITKPPCTVVECYYLAPDRSQGAEMVFYWIRDPAGLRFKDLLDAHDRAMADHPDDDDQKMERQVGFVLSMPVSRVVHERWKAGRPWIVHLCNADQASESDTSEAWET